MDKSAIQHIQDTAAQNFAIVEIEKSVENVAVMHKDFGLADLEQYLPHRRRFKGKYQTNAPSAFVEYLFEHADESVNVFVSQDKLNATAILNMGDNITPGHCDHTAHVALNMSAPFLALEAVHKEKLSQKNAAEWIEDWNQFIRILGEDRQEIPMAAAVASIRKMTVEQKRAQESSVGTFRQERTAMESIEARAETKPAYLEFTCVPHASLKPRTVLHRINILLGGEAPNFTFRPIQWETMLEEMIQEFTDNLMEEIQDRARGEVDAPKFFTLVGSFSK